MNALLLLLLLAHKCTVAPVLRLLRKWQPEGGRLTDLYRCSGGGGGGGGGDWRALRARGVAQVASETLSLMETQWKSYLFQDPSSFCFIEERGTPKS